MYVIEKKNVNWNQINSFLYATLKELDFTNSLLKIFKISQNVQSNNIRIIECSDRMYYFVAH